MSSRRIADALYVEEVARARAMSPGDKQGADALLADRLARLRALERR